MSQSVRFPQTHGQALALAILGIVILSPDALLIKFISVDVWTLMFYRGLLLLPFLLFWLVLTEGRRAPVVVRSAGRAGLASGVLYGLSTVCFVMSIRHTTAANTLVVLGAMPLVAILMRRMVQHQPTPLRTWGASLIALAAIAYLSGGGAVTSKDDLIGIGAALGATLFISGHFTVLSAYPEIDRVTVLLAGACFIILAGAALAPTLTVGLKDLALLAILAIAVVGLAFLAIGYSTTRLLAPEVTLIMLLEMLFGPLWVWLALDERPALATLIAGGIIGVTVTVHSLLALRARR